MSAEEMEARVEELRRVNRDLRQELQTERQRRQRVADEAQAIINEYADKIARLEDMVIMYARWGEE